MYTVLLNPVQRISSSTKQSLMDLRVYLEVPLTLDRPSGRFVMTVNRELPPVRVGEVLGDLSCLGDRGSFTLSRGGVIRIHTYSSTDGWI